MPVKASLIFVSMSFGLRVLFCFQPLDSLSDLAGDVVKRGFKLLFFFADFRFRLWSPIFLDELLHVRV